MNSKSKNSAKKDKEDNLSDIQKNNILDKKDQKNKQNVDQTNKLKNKSEKDKDSELIEEIENLKEEKLRNIDNIKGCIKFKKKCELSKKKLSNKINNIIKSGKIIAGYGATSKSTTILNYCNINYKHIKYIRVCQK